ncbi:hypothetical protein BHG93_21550 [Salmonella enterica]|nr:hypothetical protein [Salmonella enterica]
MRGIFSAAARYSNVSCYVVKLLNNDFFVMKIFEDFDDAVDSYAVLNIPCFVDAGTKSDSVAVKILIIYF